MNTARPWAGTKKDKETTEHTEHAEKQIDVFREFRAFRSCQKLIVVERLSGNVFQLFAVSNTDLRCSSELGLSHTERLSSQPAQVVRASYE